MALTASRIDDLKSVPSEFTFVHDSKSSSSDSIPTVDFSLLVSGNADQRSKTLLDLGKACEEWGFFVLINHGIPETLMKAVIDVSLEFFDLPEEEKRRYEAKSVSDPISAGTGITCNTSSNHKFLLWRDFVKSYLHPQFYCPEKPQRLRNIMSEYSEKIRWVLKKLLQGVSENLNLEQESMDEALNLDSCSQLYAANLYPPCPQPDEAIGIPPHTDHGLLSFLIHNGVAGLQIQHNGDWFHTNSPENAILINVGDQLEIFSNGRYKSVKHRAVVNTEATRISVVLANGPAPDAVVSPSAELVRRDGRGFYAPMKYKEFIETKLTNRYGEMGIMERLKINQDGRE
ncbi:putative 2-oxoglutarate/Fe(II)-dependent dioxygenase [Dorcoceras hygrometricum]|uniref:Putative 2-oxoglutarate/Fe(II)-dependent dioxygenase n=1 Tax=Dorcoceras hygrometricum TaxID=472368 RepID=A0A2Z7D0S8_9LAMI|nr:putative 2-oxoglutarate/Fe(II)-dependent dioxygenase [Dorcoceras hygrometricum]